MVPEAAAPVSGYHRAPMAVHFGSFTLDVPRRHLSRDATSIHVTPKAFDLLALLVEQAPRVVGKGELHERLWPGTFVSDATLVGLVKELRRALDDRDAGSPIIRTVHRVGYAFCPDVPDARGHGAPCRCTGSSWMAEVLRSLKARTSSGEALHRMSASMHPVSRAATPASPSTGTSCG